MNRHDKREPRHLQLTRDLTISFLLLFKTSCAIPLYPAADYGSFHQLGSDSRSKAVYLTLSTSVCTLARLTHSLTHDQTEPCTCHHSLKQAGFLCYSSLLLLLFLTLKIKQN